MKVRTVEDFVDRLAEEISWRRKELTELKRLVETSSSNQTRQAVLTRAAVALLYAHWEGFVKAVAELYLEFVRMQRCKNCELSNNLLAVVMRAQLNTAGASNKIGPHIAMVEYFRTQSEEKAILPSKKVVRTDANLSSKVLMEILDILGIEAAEYSPKWNLLDNSLLARRNHIAHGNLLPVEAEDYLALHEEIVALMALFRNSIENAAVTKAFLKTA